jgi:HPt (histidine-containing phosphotransfer) domain-containing protein
MKQQPIDHQEQTSIDMACLQELRDITSCNGNLKQFNRIIGTFQDALEPQLESMRQALAAGNAEDMAVLAHSLKGSAASIGARRLALLCSVLEEVSLKIKPGAPGQILAQIEREAQLVTQVLEHQQQKH